MATGNGNQLFSAFQVLSHPGMCEHHQALALSPLLNL